MILTIGNQKGGVGKTTISLNIAAGYARLNLIDKDRPDRKVLVIDLDGQANLTRLCLGNRYSNRFTIYDCMNNPKITKSCIHKVKKFNFDIIPAKAELFSYGTLSEDGKQSLQLMDVIDRVKDLYDLIIIDTSPALNDLTTGAYLSTILNGGQILIVGEPVSTSLDGMMYMLNMVFKPMIRKYRKPVNWSFLFNKATGSTYEKVFIDSKNIPNFLKTTIKDDATAVRRSNDTNRAVIFRKRQIGKDLRDLIKELIERGVY